MYVHMYIPSYGISLITSNIIIGIYNNEMYFIIIK